jgi:hypothetical protein
MRLGFLELQLIQLRCGGAGNELEHYLDHRRPRDRLEHYLDHRRPRDRLEHYLDHRRPRDRRHEQQLEFRRHPSEQRRGPRQRQQRRTERRRREHVVSGRDGRDAEHR